MDINIEMFRKTSPDKKIAIINSANENDLLRVTEATIVRIVKEVGKKEYGHTRDKELYFEKASNNWNSTIGQIEYKAKTKSISVDVYFQYGNTDMDRFVSWRDFASASGDYVLYHQYQYWGCNSHYGETREVRVAWHDYQKAEVIRNILLQYVTAKAEKKIAEQQAAA